MNQKDYRKRNPRNISYFLALLGRYVGLQIDQYFISMRKIIPIKVDKFLFSFNFYSMSKRSTFLEHTKTKFQLFGYYQNIFSDKINMKFKTVKKKTLGKLYLLGTYVVYLHKYFISKAGSTPFPVFHCSSQM